MYEEITQKEFRGKIKDLIYETKEAVLYSMDFVKPLLEADEDVEVLPYLSGQASLPDLLITLYNNIDVLKKDNLVPEQTSVVYFIDDRGLPSKANKEEYDILLQLVMMECEDIPYKPSAESIENANMFI